MSTLSTPRRRFGGRRTAVIVASVVTVLLLAGLAWAAFVGRAQVKGGGSSGRFAATWDTVTNTVYPGTTTTTQTPPTLASGALTLPTGLEFFPGDVYGWNGKVRVDGTRDGYISGLSLPGLPKGYSARIVSGCGTKITAGSSTAAAAVTVEITMTDTAATDGTAWTLGTAGVEVTPLASGAAVPSGVTCPAYTPAA